jgi:hypothetical protein
VLGTVDARVVLIELEQRFYVFVFGSLAICLIFLLIILLALRYKPSSLSRIRFETALYSVHSAIDMKLLQIPPELSRRIQFCRTSQQSPCHE